MSTGYIQRVEAVKVSKENIRQVAAWCGGWMKTDGRGDYILLKVSPLDYSAVEMGDYVVRNAELSFSVYGSERFTKLFQPEAVIPI